MWIPLAAIAVIGLVCMVWRAVRFQEGGRMIVLLVLCIFSMLFWGFFELAGSTVTRFTEDVVDRTVFGYLGNKSDGQALNLGP